MSISNLRGFVLDKYNRFNTFFCFSLLRDIVICISIELTYLAFF
jgi:hypothetical protein